jgi:hypothetical protein
MVRTLFPTVARSSLVAGGAGVSVVAAASFVGELTHTTIVKIFSESMIFLD